MNLKIGNAIVAVVLGAALLCITAPRASADSDHGRSKCQRQVEKAQDKYRHEVHEHGKHSRQADEARAKVNATWDRCWNEARGWYDPQRHEWRTDRDWDRNYDWDRDHD